jgi:anti-anti-sigma factor
MFSTPMEASFEQLGPVLLIAVSGRLDTLTAPRFDEKISPLLVGPHRRILLDVSGLDYISSAGLRSILQVAKAAEANGGKAGLFSVPAQVAEVLEIAGLSSRLDVYADCASALQANP